MFLWVALFLASAVGTEAFAYAMHRYVMHGPGWFLHKSHHQSRHDRFEWNDTFHLAFSIPSVVWIYFGLRGHPWQLPIGIGMAAYGVANWAFHDVLVHRRIHHRWLPKRGYLRRIVQAHHIHHRTHTRLGAESFGFFWAPDYGKRRRS